MTAGTSANPAFDAVSYNIGTTTAARVRDAVARGCSMKRILCAIALLASLVLLVACGSDDDDGAPADQPAQDAPSGDVQAQLDEINTQLEGIRSRLDFHDESIQQAKMLGALNTFHAEDLHGLDEEMQAASEVGAEWSARAERMLQAAQSVEWPDELQDRAHGVEDTLDAIIDALAEGDLATAKGLVTEAHEGWHEVEHDAYHIVAGPQEHGHEHPHEDETETPTAAPGG